MYMPTNLSTLVKALAVVMGLWFLQPVGAVAGTIQHLVIPANPVSGNTFTLPNYGAVQVTHNYSPAADFTRFHQTGAENQSAGSFSWGTDTDRFNIFNTHGGFQDYVLTFNFQNGPPDVSRLLLIVVGLAGNTTATVSAPGSLVGEFHFPPPLPGGTSTTLINGMVLSSKNDGDPVNTGWALYQPTGAFTSLTVNMHQQAGDGVGWTLAYAEPTPAQTTKDVYAVKFLCGSFLPKPPTPPVNGVEWPVKPGNYFTAINVHNPNGGSISFKKKAVLLYRADKPPNPEQLMPPGNLISIEVPPDWGFEIDCADIRNKLLSGKAPGAPTFIKGWVVIEVMGTPNQPDPRPIDVTAVYTSHGWNQSTKAPTYVGFAEDVEQVLPKRVKP